MLHAAVSIMPGVDYFPGFLDRAAQEALRDEVLAILEARAAVPPAHAPHRQAVFGHDEQLRTAGLGLRRTRLSLPGDTSGNRAPVAGYPVAARHSLRRDRPGRASAGGLPDQPVRPRRADGPAPGSRRGGACRARGLLSLGDTALFRVGGLQRNAPTRSFRLASGDAMSLAGEGRLAFHGVDRIIAGSSTLLPEGGRINLTLRRVTKASA